MAIIIPMAKMPNNCEECDLKALCPDYWTKIREEYTRPSWCQLDDLDATTFCGVPMEEAVEIMHMYRQGELVHLADRKTEPTISKMEQVDEPQTKCQKCKSFQYNGWYCVAKANGYPCHYEPKDEPQTDCSWK